MKKYLLFILTFILVNVPVFADVIPYFINTFNIFPVPTDYFLEMGEDYGMDNESIYYCGPYIMTTFEPQEQRVYEINPNYWDLDN